MSCCKHEAFKDAMAEMMKDDSFRENMAKMMSEDGCHGMMRRMMKHGCPGHGNAKETSSENGTPQGEEA